VCGVVYLCGTKPPRDMAKLLNRHKELAEKYKDLNETHKVVLDEQKSEVEKQKLLTSRLSSGVVNFQDQNSGLKQNVSEMQHVVEYIANNSEKQLCEIADEIDKFKGYNENYSKMIEDLNTNINCQEELNEQAAELTNEQLAEAENTSRLNDLADRAVANQDSAVLHFRETIRVSDLKDDLEEISEAPTHRPSVESDQDLVVSPLDVKIIES